MSKWNTILEKQFASQGMFLIRSKLSITAFLFLVLYRSTALQSQSFLINIESLCKQKLVNNRSIPSTHAKRKITNLSGKHSFTLHPSLSLYRQTDRQTDRQRNKYTCCAWAGETFFPIDLLCQFYGSCGKQVLVLLTYLEYNTVVVLCQYFGSGRKQFLVLHTYLEYNTVVHCASFLVVAGNSSQNENTF